jgi:hypothetical protein
MARAIDGKLQPLKEQLEAVETAQARLQGTDPNAPSQPAPAQEAAA